MLLYSENFGDTVVCDFCNDDGKLSYGGVLIGSNAVCGKCSEKNGYYKSNFEYKDEIDEIFNKKQTFQDNVLSYRKKTYGTSDNIIKIHSWDEEE
tara:strand:+ start:5404 stop:5688 length:285 start_codon:yes stop_codon:yes gene_type:complete